MKQKVIHGDCLEEMKKLEDNSVDCIITDPPYNVLSVEWDKNEIDFNEIAKEWNRILKVNGIIYIFGQMPMMFNVYNNLSKYFKFKQDLVWYKNRGFSLTKTTFTKYHENILFFVKGNEEILKEFGKYLKKKRKEKKLTVEKLKPMIGMPNLYAKDNQRNIDGGFNFFETGMTSPKREYYDKLKDVLGLDNRFDCLFDRPNFNFDDIKLKGEPYKITRKEQKVYGVKSNMGEFTQVNEGFRNPKTVLEYSIIQGGKEYVGHPTQKPVELLKYLIKSCSNEGDVILDCFAGSFSTLIACQQLNRNGIGIELDEKFCEIGRKRLSQQSL